jgi:dTDP-4-dehydrorhamnose reductase
MKILILGVSGLIGHKLLQEFSESFEVFGTLHRTKKYYGDADLFSGQNIIQDINVLEFEKLKGVIEAINPDFIVNCVGITKRKIDSNNIVEPLKINSVFPHELAMLGLKLNKRIIHFSTDCVFNGRDGNYTEESLTTAEDVYGRTKALGELKYKNTLTIRSSFIGQELFGKTELLDWFLSQNGKQVKGFRKTYYSGVSTIFMARVVKKILINYPNLSGLYQLAPEKPISKYDLLCIARDTFKVKIDIIPEDEHVHLPTLDGSKLKSEIDIVVPPWTEMMNELSACKNYYSN